MGEVGPVCEDARGLERDHAADSADVVEHRAGDVGAPGRGVRTDGIVVGFVCSLCKLQLLLALRLWESIGMGPGSVWLAQVVR